MYDYRKPKIHSDEKGWCWKVATILDSIDSLDIWFSEDVGGIGEWNSFIKKEIRAREQSRWFNKMSLCPKLRLYRTHKKSLFMEEYV